jgi:hypothetical protein
MTLIIETEVPDWVRWVAQDEDGEWYAHQNEPELFDKWRHWSSDGRITKIGCSDRKNPRWRETLHEVVVK